MSRVDDLIRKSELSGVRYRAIADVASYVRGVTYSKNDEDSNGPIRVLRSNNISLSSNTLNFDDVRRVSSVVRVRRDQRLMANDILVSAASGSKAHVGKVAFVREDLDYCFGGFMGVLRTTDEVEPRFLFHLLVGRTFAEYLDLTLTSTTINNLTSSIIGAFRIPVPSLEVQRGIVKILDWLTGLETELEAELGAELEARRRQYAFYRDQVMAAPKAGSVRRIPIGEALTLRAGKFVAASDISGEPDASHLYPCFGGNGLRGYVATPNQDGDYVLIGRQGALSGNVKRVSGKFYATEHAIVVTPVLDFDTSWLFHELTAMNLNQYVSQGAQPGLAVSNLNKILMPIPDIDEQRRIASILDKFDALVTDLRVGLPAELSARRKQYEYYRDRLLTFEEAPA